jgi:hypothetical protein
VTARWTDRAVDDLARIVRRAPRSAAHVFAAVTWLSTSPFPRAFRRYVDGDDERVLSVPPYIVVYSVVGDDVVIRAVLDSRRSGADW